MRRKLAHRPVECIGAAPARSPAGGRRSPWTWGRSQAPCRQPARNLRGFCRLDAPLGRPGSARGPVSPLKGGQPWWRASEQVTSPAGSGCAANSLYPPHLQAKDIYWPCLSACGAIESTPASREGAPCGGGLPQLSGEARPDRRSAVCVISKVRTSVGNQRQRPSPSAWGCFGQGRQKKATMRTSQRTSSPTRLLEPGRNTSWACCWRRPARSSVPCTHAAGDGGATSQA